MKYLLDTNTVSYALRGEGRVGARMQTHKPSELAVSAMTVAELRFGVYRRRSQKPADLVDAFLAPITEVPFDAAAADRYGKLAAALQAAGTPIGHFDTLIAAHALVLDFSLVTRNRKHFEQVDGLRLEDWF